MDPHGFFLLAMRYALKRTFAEMVGPEAVQAENEKNTKRVKYLHIDKRADRYVTPLRLRLNSITAVAKRNSPRVEMLPEYAARRIAIWWKSSAGLRKVVNNTDDKGHHNMVRFRGKDIICPITQDTVETGYAFTLVTETSAVVVYSTPDLIGYILANGKFDCCLTRSALSLPTVRRLAKKGVGLGVEGAETLPRLFLNRDAILHHRINEDNAILAIEVTCGNAMIEILDVCANLELSTDAAMARVTIEILPEWRQLVNDYISHSAASCRVMLLADREKLRRLSMAAISNPHGMISLVQEEVERVIERCNARIDRTESQWSTTPMTVDVAPIELTDLIASITGNHNRLITPSFETVGRDVFGEFMMGEGGFLRVDSSSRNRLLEHAVRNSAQIGSNGDIHVRSGRASTESDANETSNVRHSFHH
jgi:hypothetical protein